MAIYGVVTTDKELFGMISENINSHGSDDKVFCIDDPYEAANYMSIEIPDIIFINFSDDDIDSFIMIEAILEDQWLINSGIIAISSSINDAKRLEEIQGYGVNIIVNIDKKHVSTSLSKIMSIIRNNYRILFQRGLSLDMMEHISGAFSLKNDTLEVKCYANLICNFLFSSKKINKRKKYDLYISLTEMLFNAIEHGNCNISFEEKSKWLESGMRMDDLIAQRMENHDVSSKSVVFEYTISPDAAHFYISDEGDGFDWNAIIETNAESPNGRGIIMAKLLTENLRYNEKGNTVSFDLFYNKNESDLRPGLFKKIEPRTVSKGDVIIRQGEESNYLYYIVSGHYNVLVDGMVVSCLDSDDIFMGEMSFLLNSYRSATVQAQKEGQLIEISKKEFVQCIKEKPHYALFLTRILAKRIQMINQKIASGKTDRHDS